MRGSAKEPAVEASAAYAESAEICFEGGIRREAKPAEAGCEISPQHAMSIRPVHGDH